MNLENLDAVVDFIIEHHLIEKGDRVGVGVSGGADSMALLHFLNSLSEPLDIKVIAVNVNHNIRPGSRKESAFVKKYCGANGIEYAGLNADVPGFAKSQKIGIEQAARIKRYECFEAAAKRFKLNKFAVAHHQGDQAETILLHIFRGSGVAGAGGMDAARPLNTAAKHGHGHEHDHGCILIRPFLQTAATDIVAYNYRNQIPHVEDESNADDGYARNFLRNQVFPVLQREWRGVEKNIVEFGHACHSDDEYLNSIVNMDAILGDGNHVRIPLNFFVYPYPVISRIVLAALDIMGARENIEKKHIDMILTLAASGENGSRADLPGAMFCVKEYEYIAIVRRQSAAAARIYSFKIGRTNFAEFGTIIVTKTISYKEALERSAGDAKGVKSLVIDVDKLPRASKWRTRKDGDVFNRFGGGTKNLNAYLIDCKIPARTRDKLPVLAYGNEIFAVAGVEISEKVRTDRETLEAYVVEVVRD